MPAELTILAPASKSATQRALLLSALADGTSTLHNPLDCEDSRAFADALGHLGVQIQQLDDRWIVKGAQLKESARPLYCANAGTCIRFLSAVALLLPSSVTLEAGDQLSKRPLADIAEALKKADVMVEFPNQPGFAPLVITPGVNTPRVLHLDASRTSQFLSGLLMIAPLLGGLTIHTDGQVTSRPYVDLTLSLISEFNGPPIQESNGTFTVPGGSYQSRDFHVEGDWSAAAMILVGAWISGQRVTLPNLNHASVQGDRAIVSFLEELELSQVHRFDLSTCPDLITPLSIACAFSKNPSEIRNVAHARIKESDRISATVNMLNAVGIAAESLEDGLRISPGTSLHAAEIEDFGDHRVAMAAGLLSLRIPGVTATHPDCVGKSFPEFWETLEALRCS